MTRLRPFRLALVALAALLAWPAAAPAAPSSLQTTVSSADAVARDCFARVAQGEEGYAQRELTADGLGWITARLDADGGDWDLAVFDADTGRAVAGSASFGASEVASGIVLARQELIVQACRRSGGSTRARLDVQTTATESAGKAEKVSLVRVSVPNNTRKQQLVDLGLDLSEHGGSSFLGVVLHGAKDAAKLRKAGFSYVTETADLVKQGREDRAADRAFSRRVSESALPSGRTTYRVYANYGTELKKLVEENPNIARPIVLPFKTFEGRTVEGIEIASNPSARDGRPVFLNVGVHHAREWPSGEHAMEWAYELVNGYKAGDARVRNIVENSRTIVIPLINPDGFNASRSAATTTGRDGRGSPTPGEQDEIANIVANPNEYRRKNCRLPNQNSGNCAQPAFGLASGGVDPNRNYGQFWAGPGASGDVTNETYYGPGPFSEPETQNLRDLVSKRHVTTLITNHTFSDLVLRAPGLASLGLPVDADIYKDLGDRMAAQNGYISLFGYQLYDTTGTTEDWSYNATGGLGFTFEVGCVNLDYKAKQCVSGHFHPPYREMVKEYEGTTKFADTDPETGAARDGGGNREAYFIASEHTIDATKHSVIEGSARPGAVLRLKKTFQTATSRKKPDGTPVTFEDILDTTMEVPASGSYRWDINPSTRPIVAQERGRVATGPPSPQVKFSGAPGPSAAPCGAVSSSDTCSNDHVFEVPPGPAVDNVAAVVRIDWLTPGSDWDMSLFRANADGKPEGPALGTSAQGPTDFEQITLAGPDFVPGKYVLRVVNFAATEPYDGSVTFEGPQPYQPGMKESWTLTCEFPEGTVIETRELTIDRNQRQAVDLPCSGPPATTNPTDPGTTTGSPGTTTGAGSTTGSGTTGTTGTTGGAAVVPRPVPAGRRFLISRRARPATSRGLVPIIVSCRQRAACSGTIRLRTAARVRSGRKVQRLILGRRTFKVPARRRTVIRMRISRAGLALLRSERRLRVLTIANVSPEPGVVGSRRGTSVGSFRLAAPRRGG